jgi:integrase
MSRPELPVGTWGRIRREKVQPGSFRARARFRDYDGVTRNVEAWGATGAAAERQLLIKLRERVAPTHGEINRETRIGKLAELWLDEITSEDRIAQQTIDNYRWALERTILPAVGELRLREATVSRLDRFFKTVAINHPAKARIARTVLGQMLAMAVRHDALAANPVRDVGRLRKPRRTVRALAVSDLQQVRDAIRAWQQPAAPMPGPRRTPDLAHIVDILLATGGRIGEVLALRWHDIDLDTAPARLTFAGTIVYVKGRGYHRQPWTKSDAGYRTLTLPRFAVHVLQQRHADATAGGQAPVFPSRRGTWLSPHNVRRQWRQARQDTGLEWVTPHTFRKTVATLLDREANTATAAAQLGHASEEITSTYYVQKAHQAPDVSDLLDRLGAGRRDDHDTLARSR